MKFTLTGIACFIIAALIGLGELAWIILVFIWGVRIAIDPSRGRIVRGAAAAASIAILTAHFAGYKFFGSATIHDNRPVLDSARQLASIAAPNLIFATDGSRIEVRGVTFTPALLVLSTEELNRFLSRSSEVTLIQADPSSPSGSVFQGRNQYFCGNTFYPTFIPDRLPAYSKADVGNYLAAYGLATIDKPE